MKKILGFVMMTAVMLSSCGNDHDDLYDPAMAAKLKANQYAEAFHAIYGDVAPNHTWGFGSSLGSRVGLMDVNANMWGNYVEVPSPLTENQKNLVTKWFESNKNPQSVAVQWCDYFAQQVSSTDNGVYMNEVKDGDGTHLNNFNKGDQGLNENVWAGELTNPTDQNTKVFYSDKILYVKGGNTQSYSYYNSYDSYRCDKFVIIPGAIIDPSLDGMFFLGFDYESPKSNIEFDGYYNDWIIKLTPCEYVKAYRIIAEDLGTIGDFDFNDVVFDAYIDGNDAVVTLQAAGGTLPLTVAGKEVHELFGVETNVMVNTGVGATKTPVMFRVSNCNNIDNIQIVVNDPETSTYTLSVATGEAPQKICVDPSYEITSERQRISVKYPKFLEYVKDPSVKWY